jgi:hypothetical protein
MIDVVVLIGVDVFLALLFWVVVSGFGCIIGEGVGFEWCLFVVAF